jgi:ABC-type glycerol-3-phosphate transport system substrate-binding protein
VQEAFEVIEFMCTDAGSDIIWDAHGFLSGRKSWVEKSFDAIVGDTPQMEFFLRSMTEADESVPCPICPISSFVGQKWGEAVGQVNYGDKTPEEAAKDLQATATEEIQREFPDLFG